MPATQSGPAQQSQPPCQTVGILVLPALPAGSTPSPGGPLSQALATPSFHINTGVHTLSRLQYQLIKLKVHLRQTQLPTPCWAIAYYATAAAHMSASTAEYRLKHLLTLTKKCANVSPEPEVTSSSGPPPHNSIFLAHYT